MVYSKEFIQKTIQVWQPHSKDKLTEDDAREIAANMADLFILLADLDWKYKKPGMPVVKNQSA